MILITGFAPYRESSNASAVLVQSMRDCVPEILHGTRDRLAFEIVAVDDRSRESEHRTLEMRLLALLHQYRPALCLFTGQAPACNQVTFEKIATNSFMREIIDPARPVAYRADLPELEHLPELLRTQGIPASHSYYGGQHLCNHILFSSLHFAALQGLPHRSGFMHIPVLPEQVCSDHPQAPSMCLELTRKALSLVIRALHQSAHAGARSATE